MTENHSFHFQIWSENQIGLSEFVFKNSLMETQNIYDSHHRYVNLRTQEMFDNLVDLYAKLFMTQWHHFKKFMKYSFPPPPGVSPQIYAARCYISMWFIDLYVSNREAVRKLYPVAFIERYREQFPGVPHDDNRVCSWFPPEDKYNLEDLTLAFILGTACTPNLGVRDVDDWQFFAEGVVPQNPNPMNYNRVVDRRFYGSYEVRTMEIQTRLGEEAQEVDREMPRFELIDWVYHHRVVLEMDNHKRTTAHRRISLAYN
ncbi:hypothetical protein Lser_V15G11400 [Lactuca serriola]